MTEKSDDAVLGMSRQVLDCGDGVRAIAALAWDFHRLRAVGCLSAVRAKAVTAQTPSPQSKTLTRCFYALDDTDNFGMHRNC